MGCGNWRASAEAVDDIGWVEARREGGGEGGGGIRKKKME
jgi:hypothetical protein